MKRFLLKIVFVSIFAVPLQIYGQTAVDSFSQLMKDKKGLEDEIAAKQSELASLPQPTPIKIIEAKWGRALSWKSVTSVLQDELSKQGGFKLSLSNASVGTKGDGLAPKSWQVKLFGKFFWGSSKTLKIKYFDGEKEEYEEIKQGKPLDLESFDLSKLNAARKALQDDIAAKQQELREITEKEQAEIAKKERAAEDKKREEAAEAEKKEREEAYKQLITAVKNANEEDAARMPTVEEIEMVVNQGCAIAPVCSVIVHCDSASKLLILQDGRQGLIKRSMRIIPGGFRTMPHTGYQFLDGLHRDTFCYFSTYTSNIAFYKKNSMKISNAILCRGNSGKLYEIDITITFGNEKFDDLGAYFVVTQEKDSDGQPIIYKTSSIGETTKCEWTESTKSYHTVNVHTGRRIRIDDFLK